MRSSTGRQKRRGIALLLALLTSVILVTLSLAFMSLSLTEARTSRSYSFEETSLQAASYGLEFALAYMGHGNQPRSTWDSRSWWQPGDPPALQFGFYNVLRAYPEAAAISEQWVSVSDLSKDASLESLIPGNLSDSEKNRLRADLRRIRLVTPEGQPRLTQLNSELAFTSDIVVEPLLVSRSQGRHDFRLISTARVYPLSEGRAPSIDLPLASRVVEARVKESSFDYAHFVANGRTWNVNGHTPDGTAPAPDSGDSQAPAADLADFVLIPPDYREEGPMRVDGQDPAQVPPRSARARAVANSGNLKFAEGSDQGRVNFTHRLTINRPANLYQDPNLNDSTMGGFTAGFVPLSQRVGIPDFRSGDMKRAASYSPRNTDQSGLISIATSEIPGALGSRQPAPRGSDPELGPFYEGYKDVVVEGKVMQVPKAFDYRPRFPHVEVTLDQDSVRIVKRDTATQAIVSSQELKQSQLAMGLLYVEGGNVVVKTQGGVDSDSGRFRGRLSIAAGEHPGRESQRPSSDSIYSQAARDFYNFEKQRWDQAKRLGQRPQASDFQTPPYTVEQLRQAHQANPDRIAAPEPGLLAQQPMWPQPEAETLADGTTRYKVEREGNIVIADDVVYDRTPGNSLGLFAQNFVLLNDSTPSPTLNVDAVLMSKERSVSLDWDNTGRQDPASWRAMMETKNEKGEEISRVIKINGSVIGEYIDVEGDLKGRGYKKQEFKYDLALRNANPPFMPKPDLANLAGGYRFMILHYQDRGTLSSAGLLP